MTAKLKQKLTVTSVEKHMPGLKDFIIWDTELTGFGCKVTPKNRRMYFLYYRTKAREQRRLTIGNHESMKPGDARDIARKMLAEVAQGFDPSRSRAAALVAPTVNELCTRYMSEYAETRKKASSIRNDRRLIDTHVLPNLGNKKVASVVRSDMMALHHSLRSTPYEANRMLAMCSKMFGLAERWSLIPDGTNPARNIDRYREEKRERYLTQVEISRLWSVLNSDRVTTEMSVSAVAAVKLLMLTGRRLSEVLALKWAWIDLDARTLRLPDSKSGALLVSLGDMAIEILINLKTAGHDDIFVIPGKLKGKPLVNLQKPWRKIRAEAGLSDVRIHDLRHTFASVGAGLGMSLPLLGRLLGHTQASTTNRYAHLSQDPVRLAADAIGAELIRMTLSDSLPVKKKQ